MVGSGFSRNAERLHQDAGIPPLWGDITEGIIRDLFPGMDNPPIDDPLRLAQKYKNDFGRSGLHSLLSKLATNDEFVPGEIHRRLLRLPWRDIFTTNWDTLLERASSEIAEPSYSVIQDKDQLPLLSQPRIIKLHGSFPAQFPLIVTAEDYQTYREENAPFVNTVQQAMMETVLCLIGFSGDDPNFLNWSKWVYDNLGDASPKIYLAGFLKLSHHRRHELESRNVVPIDVGNHPRSHTWPEHRRDEYAAQWLLQTLEEGEPYDRTNWPGPSGSKRDEISEHLKPVERVSFDIPKSHAMPEMDRNQQSYDEQEIDRIKEILAIWKRNRTCYPGWLVFPSESAQPEFSRQTEAWEPHILRSLPSLDPIESLNAIREVVWRREISLEPFTPDLVDAAQNVLNAIDCNARLVTGSNSLVLNWAEVRESWRTVACALVTCSRFDCDQLEFEQRIDSLAPFLDDSPDVRHRIHQERCLWKLFSSDLLGFDQELNNWQVQKGASVWMLRKAALLSEARRHDEAQSLVQIAVNSLRKRVADERSIANASFFSWALGSTLTWENRRSVERKWDEFASLKCDIRNELEHIRRILNGTVERETPPSFDLTLGTTVSVKWSGESAARRLAAHKAIRILEVTGLPIVTSPQDTTHRPVSMVSDVLTAAADELARDNTELAIRLVLRISNYDQDKTLLRVLSRNNLATLSDAEVERLAKIATTGIEYFLPRLFALNEPKRGISSLERLRVFLEVLSRLVLRLTPELVVKALDLGLRCYRDDRVAGHIWLGGPLSNLLERSWEALPIHLRHDRVFDLLTAPIVGMNGFTASEHSPDPSDFWSQEDLPVVCNPTTETRYRETVKSLVQGLRSDNDDARSISIRRLWQLAVADKLKEDERTEIAESLWVECDPIQSTVPSRRSPLDWVFIVLPELVSGQALNSFKSKWLANNSSSTDVEDGHSFEALRQLGAAITSLQSLDSPLAISDIESEHVADYISDVLSKYPARATGFSFADAEPIRQLGTVSLAISISGNRAKEIFEHVRLLMETENVPPGSSLHQFLRPGFELRSSMAFRLIPCLATVLPERLEVIGMWLTTALVSSNKARVQSAMTTVREWVSAQESGAAPIVPENVVKVVGAIIASRREDAIAAALWCAVSIFNHGNDQQREAISSFVQHGLIYLVEEMQYNSNQYNADVSTIRLLCVQLAASMAKKGYGSLSGVQMWLSIGKTDSFPEIRSEAIFLDFEEGSE